MLLGLAFGSHHANTTTYGNNQTTVLIQKESTPNTGISPGDGGPGSGGGTTGDTGQTPPPFTNP
ncbi:hypothetical protein JI747_008700 [Chryseobacterium sp. RG1]|uniref:Uncharacterized protein n=1 Tax=Chryseobacterium tagetis TaxID=2801334 RepID=A0ABS7ZZU5_9FLAO|nr:hypothetical protein [Chryseobacterium tagetis]MCA6067252.1 hypothetical protein [Chryseobacterium tagetis]